MSNFPVTSSILSSTHIAAFIRDQYALGSSTDCRIIKAGINDTYLVTSEGEKFVFRIYSLSWRSVPEIEEEIKLLSELKDHGISVSYPLADKHNQYIQTLNAPEGERFAVLFTFAEGEKLHNTPHETHFRIGELMARFHSITEGREIKRINYSSEIILVDALKSISLFLNADSDEMRFMKRAQAFLLKELEHAQGSQIRKGIVHLDIWFDNLNITGDDKITLFDFDFCGNGWLVLDIAYYILQLHNLEKYEAKDYVPKVESFIQGYESVTAISAEEKRLIPILGVSLYFFYLGVQCQRYDNWSNSFLNENYLKRFINGLVKRYYEIYELG